MSWCQEMGYNCHRKGTRQEVISKDKPLVVHIAQPDHIFQDPMTHSMIYSDSEAIGGLNQLLSQSAHDLVSQTPLDICFTNLLHASQSY